MLLLWVRWYRDVADSKSNNNGGIEGNNNNVVDDDDDDDDDNYSHNSKQWRIVLGARERQKAC